MHPLRQWALVPWKGTTYDDHMKEWKDILIILDKLQVDPSVPFKPTVDFAGQLVSTVTARRQPELPKS